MSVTCWFGESYLRESHMPFCSNCSLVGSLAVLFKQRNLATCPRDQIPFSQPALTNMSFLISTKPSDSNLSIALHPLVLLTASDQITRTQLRDLKKPVVGAILGQQKGREITAEHAFPCSMIEDTTGRWLLDQEWMERRIQQCR